MQNEAKSRFNRDRFLTITEAATFLKVSADTLRRWEKKGIITPQRSKGGVRRYTLLDLKIAKLNKRKIKFFQIPTLFKQNYINSKRDIKIVLFTSFFWIFGILIYNFLAFFLTLPTNPEQKVLSDQLKTTTHLKMASETNAIKASSINALAIKNDASVIDKNNPKTIVEVSLTSDLLLNNSNELNSLIYTDNLNQYYLLQPLPKNQIPTLIKRI